MPQSLHCSYGHLIFSTKERRPLITPDLEPRLYGYLGGIVRGENATLIAVNGTANHVHLLIRASKSVADQQFMSKVKGQSSRWINELRKSEGDTIQLAQRFAWQDGYGWFSVSPTTLEAAKTYIHNQKVHHEKITFEDELLKLLKRYRIECDERYLWD